MERGVALFFARPFLEATAFASQTKFNYIWRLWRISTANFDNSLHVNSLCSNESARNLEIFIILDLNVKSASIFNCWAIVVVFLSAVVAPLLTLILLETSLVIEVTLLGIERRCLQALISCVDTFRLKDTLQIELGLRMLRCATLLSIKCTYFTRFVWDEFCCQTFRSFLVNQLFLLLVQLELYIRSFYRFTTSWLHLRRWVNN